MKQTSNLKARHTVYLFLTSLIWGSAFVAQSAGNVMGPFTFVSLRNYLGFFVLLPCILLLRGNFQISRDTLLGGISCGVILCLASNVQQISLLYTSPGKAGFITACYMVLVPIAGLFCGRGLKKRVAAAVFLAVVGLYFICIPAREGFSGMNRGDLLCLCCAVLFTGHILCIDHFTERADGVKMSCIQFLVCALLSSGLMAVWEQPSLSGIRAGFIPLLYAGVLSSGVGYSLQIVGQKGVNPSVAALILSLESCFAVLAGWLLLGSRLSLREGLGCVIMFGAIVLTQLPEQGEKEANVRDGKTADAGTTDVGTADSCERR